MCMCLVRCLILHWFLSVSVISFLKLQNKIQTITDKGQSLKIYCKDRYCIDQWKKNPDRPIVKIFRKYIIIFQPSLLTVWKFMGFLYLSKQYELQLQRQIMTFCNIFSANWKRPIIKKKKTGTYLHVQLIKASIFRKSKCINGQIKRIYAIYMFLFKYMFLLPQWPIFISNVKELHMVFLCTFYNLRCMTFFFNYKAT